MWRTFVAFGCLPAICALYFRLTIPETPRYTIDISFDLEKGKADTEAYLSGRRKSAFAEENTGIVKASSEQQVPKLHGKNFGSTLDNGDMERSFSGLPDHGSSTSHSGAWD
jgi:MFS transporter, PHS family, inorganic phosphate transporter